LEHPCAFDSVRRVPELLDLRFDAAPGREALLFVHGLGADRTQFDAEHEAFADDYQVVSVSLRGHGGSRHSGRGPWSLEQLAQDVLAVLEALKLPAVHYVGNSMGGNVAFELLRLAPSRLRSLTTFGTTAQLNTARPLLPLLRMVYRGLPARWRGLLAGSVGRTPEASSKISAMASQTPRRTILALLPALARFDYRPSLADAVLPISIIRGEHDTEINRALDGTLATLRARKHGTFRLHELGGAGHFANLDRPRPFADVLRTILRDVENGD